MLTFEALWSALRAAERLAVAHGLAIDARVGMLSPRLTIEFVRELGGTVACWVAIDAEAIDACESAERLTELVEREVAQALRVWKGAAAS